MKKESKLSRLPAEDETPITPEIPFLGLKFKPSAPESQKGEIGRLWKKFEAPMNALNKNSMKYKTVPQLKEATKKVVAKNKFMLSMSDEGWIFNWSLSQNTLEINVASKLSKAKVRQLLAFSFGIMIYDTGLRPAAKKYFARMIKREKPSFSGIQKYLKFLKDGSQLGRARAGFAFGFLMHLEQVGKDLKGNSLYGAVGEMLFDKETFEDNSEGIARFDIDEKAPLNYQYDPERFELFDQVATPTEKRATYSGMDYKTMLDQTGIAPFTANLMKHVMEAVNNPNHRKHVQVRTGLGFTVGTQITKDDFRVSVDLSNGRARSVVSVRVRRGWKQLNTSTRTFSSTTQYNSYMESTEAVQGLGAGMHMTASQIETAMKTKKKEISVSAALSGGWKTWNKFGFDSEKPLSRVSNSNGLALWTQKASDAKIYEMGFVDREPIVQGLLKEMIAKYRLTMMSDSDIEAEPVLPVIPMLPSRARADVLKIIKAVIAAYRSFSSNMARMLSQLSLPTSSNDLISGLEKRVADGGISVTREMQQKVHDYFLSGSSSFSDQFRRDWGYPERTSTASAPTVSNTEVDGAIKDLIISFAWFDGAFNASMVTDLLNSPQFSVVHGYDNLPKLLMYLRSKGMEERSSILTSEKLTPKTQHMQDCMEVEGFSTFWEGLGGQPSWSGVMDLTDGKYSLAALVMDQYRKIKVTTQDWAKGNPDFARSRVASSMTSVFDSDILKSFKEMDESYNLAGGLNRVDILMMEQAQRNAKIELKDMKSEGLSRVASRWLGGE